jgi:CheY-like chemotaxis protein
MRQMLQRYLKLAGVTEMRVFEAEDGRQALQLLRLEAVDLILLDLSMPVMDGLEFLQRRRAEGLAPNVPVVVVSGYSTRDRAKAVSDLGASAFIVKPFMPYDLTERVLPLLHSRDLAA